jgi:hypothetical protein
MGLNVLWVEKDNSLILPDRCVQAVFIKMLVSEAIVITDLVRRG